MVIGLDSASRRTLESGVQVVCGHPCQTVHGFDAVGSIAAFASGFLPRHGRLVRLPQVYCAISTSPSTAFAAVKGQLTLPSFVVTLRLALARLQRSNQPYGHWKEATFQLARGTTFAFNCDLGVEPRFTDLMSVTIPHGVASSQRCAYPAHEWLFGPPNCTHLISFIPLRITQRSIQPLSGFFSTPASTSQVERSPKRMLKHNPKVVLRAALTR